MWIYIDRIICSNSNTLALIAVPIVLNIIDKTREKSETINDNLYLNAVKQAVARENLSREFKPTTCEIKSNGDLSCDIGQLVIDADGKKTCGGSIKFTNGNIEETNIKYNCE